MKYFKKVLWKWNTLYKKSKPTQMILIWTILTSVDSQETKGPLPERFQIATILRFGNFWRENFASR